MKEVKKEKLVPELRFPEFEGEWDKGSIEDLGEISMCKRIFKDETSEEGEVPFFKIGTFGGSPDAYISQKKYNEYKNKYSFPKEGDILLSASGTIGRQVVYDGKPAYFQDSNIVWVDNKEEIVKNKFLKYIYENIRWITNDTTISRLYNNNLRNKKIIFPSLEEQQKIASFLSLIDKKIELLKKKKELLELYKKGVMQKIFNREIRFKDKNGNDYPEWEEKRILDIFKITRGNVLAMSEVKDEKTNKYIYPVYSSQTLNEGLVGFFNDYLFENSITWTTDGANAGYTRFREGKFYCTNVCGVLTESKYANSCVAYIINRISRRYVSYVGNPKLMNKAMGSIKVSLPKSFVEQSMISDLINIFDLKSNIVNKLIKKVGKFKKGLLQKMFI